MQKKKRKPTVILVDTKKFKTFLKTIHKDGAIDNFEYIESLNWIKQLEKEKA